MKAEAEEVEEEVVVVVSRGLSSSADRSRLLMPSMYPGIW
jgi:hypothetical protein